MGEYKYYTLREIPELKGKAAEWFHSKWGVPKEAYFECMTEYLNNKTEFGWYLCLDGDRIIAGMGILVHGTRGWGAKYDKDVYS